MSTPHDKPLRRSRTTERPEQRPDPRRERPRRDSQGRTPSGYRHYDSDVLRLLTFVSQARRLGLTLTEIRHIVALRRSGSAPCVHIRALLQQKVADLEGMLAGVRSILNSWRSADGRLAAVCPHIEAKGGDTQWKDSRSAPGARTVRRSSSMVTASRSARTRTPSFSRRRSGTS